MRLLTAPTERRAFGLIFAHEPEPFDGIVFVSRANQAAANAMCESFFATLECELLEAMA
jgi:hypothetical protein